jgi:hypothetical protein
MTQKSILLLASLLFIGFTDATLTEDVGPGNMTVDLGDSCSMSFSLSDSVGSYDIETTPYSNTIFKSASYDVYIKEAGTEDALLIIMLHIYQEPNAFPIYEHVDKTDLGGIGTSITMPVEIDGLEGNAIYNYPEGDPAVDPLKSNGARFQYYPGAWRDGEHLTGTHEVSADTFAAAMNDSRVMPIFQEVMRTIHLSGV